MLSSYPPIQLKSNRITAALVVLVMIAAPVFILSTVNTATTREQRRVKKLQWLLPYRTNVALLKSPKTFLFGAFDNNTQEGFKSIMSLEDSLKTALPIIHIYTAWGSKPEEEFPTMQVHSILEMGSIPLITWEPWLTDFDPVKYPQLRKLEDRDKGGMAEIAQGKYDFYITQWAQDARKVSYPMFVRVGHEMNDPKRFPWGLQNNSPKDFIAAWKHIREVFKKQGANNIIWVWSPHPSYGYVNLFYPGDSLVDYVGVSALNYGTIAPWSKWWTFKDIFGNYYKDLARYKKPIMITEFGCLSTGGSRSKWFYDAMDSIPQKYPAIKSVVFFHYSEDKSISPQAIDWSFKNDPITTKVITREVQKLNK